MAVAVTVSWRDGQAFELRRRQGNTVAGFRSGKGQATRQGQGRPGRNAGDRNPRHLTVDVLCRRFGVDIERDGGVFVASRGIDGHIRGVGDCLHGHVQGDRIGGRRGDFTGFRIGFLGRRGDGKREVFVEIFRQRDGQAVQIGRRQGPFARIGVEGTGGKRRPLGHAGDGHGDDLAVDVLGRRRGIDVERDGTAPFHARSVADVNRRRIGHGTDRDRQGHGRAGGAGRLAGFRIAALGRRGDGKGKVRIEIFRQGDGQTFNHFRRQADGGLTLRRRELEAAAQVQGGADRNVGDRDGRDVAGDVTGRHGRIDVQRNGPAVFDAGRRIDGNRRCVDLCDDGDVERHRIGSRRGHRTRFRVSFLRRGRNLQREVRIEVFRQGDRQAFHIRCIDRPGAGIGVERTGGQGRPFGHARDGHGDHFAVDVLGRRVGVDVQGNRAAVFHAGRILGRDRRGISLGHHFDIQGNRRAGCRGDRPRIRVAFLGRGRNLQREVLVEVLRQFDGQVFNHRRA